MRRLPGSLLSIYMHKLPPDRSKLVKKIILVNFAACEANSGQLSNVDWLN